MNIARRRSSWGTENGAARLAHHSTRATNSSDRELASLIFSICVIGLPIGATLGCAIFIRWFQ